MCGQTCCVCVSATNSLRQKQKNSRCCFHFIFCLQLGQSKHACMSGRFCSYCRKKNLKKPVYAEGEILHRLQGLTAVRVRLAEVRRSGWLNWQLRHRHLARHRVSSAQTAAIFSVRAHLEPRQQGGRAHERLQGKQTAAPDLSAGCTANSRKQMKSEPQSQTRIIFTHIIQLQHAVL